MASLAAEGMQVDPSVVQRAHALVMMIFSGLSGYPFEHLDQEPTPFLMSLSLERAEASRFCLDLVEATRPLR